MNTQHIRSIAWAVDRIMEASNDNISESGNGDDQMVAEGAPLSAQGGGDSRRESRSEEWYTEGVEGEIS